MSNIKDALEAAKKTPAGFSQEVIRAVRPKMFAHENIVPKCMYCPMKAERVCDSCRRPLCNKHTRKVNDYDCCRDHGIEFYSAPAPAVAKENSDVRPPQV